MLQGPYLHTHQLYNYASSTSTLTSAEVNPLPPSRYIAVESNHQDFPVTRATTKHGLNVDLGTNTGCLVAKCRFHVALKGCHAHPHASPPRRLSARLAIHDACSGRIRVQRLPPLVFPIRGWSPFSLSLGRTHGGV